MIDSTESRRERLILPFMDPVYRYAAEPVGWLVFRIMIGGMLMLSGWPKVAQPLGMAGMVESLGFAPGWFFSPALVAVEFLGGALIVLGLFTRPAALAAAFVLLMTLFVHKAMPYGDAFLTAEGIEFLKNNVEYLTEAGQARLLSDGGAGFLGMVQAKTEGNSLFWALGAAIIAAFGGGRLSVDRLIGREF